MTTGGQFPPPTGIRFEPPAPHRNPAWAFRVAIAFVTLLLVTVQMVNTSRAAFSSTTQNAGNTITTGTVDLVDDDLGAALIVVPAMKPGDVVTNCIVVTYNGNLDPNVVRMYSGGFVDSGDLGDYLNVTVDEGSGGAFGNCTGFTEDDAGAEFADTLTQFDALHTNYGNGFGEWDPTGAGQTKTYRISIELDPLTPNAEQNESVTAVTFDWEVQS